jgi:hypothetical protein
MAWGRMVALLTCVAVLSAACSGTQKHSSTAEPAPRPPDSSSVTLDCNGSIGAPTQPPTDYAVVFGLVGLPTSDRMRVALQTSASGDADPSARLFAKTGLLVKVDASLELVAPDESADAPWIGWGSPAKRTRRLIVGHCPGSSQWHAFAGGFWVRNPGCMALLVRAGHQERRVTIGVGAACPGQLPPPAPTES